MRALRPLTSDDLPALHALLVAAAAADGEAQTETLADLHTQFADAWSDPAADARLMVDDAGRAIGHARCYLNPAPEGEAVVQLRLDVHPAHRGPEVEGQLLDWLEARAQARLAGGAPGQPRAMRLSAPETQTALSARLAARGFAPVRYFYEMRRDLRGPLPAAAAPAGLRLSPYALALEDAVLAAHNEAFAANWGHTDVTLEDWRQFQVGSEAFRGALTQVALAGGEVAAYALNFVFDADNARRGERTAHVGLLGTRPAWRRRGAAAWLLSASLQAFAAAGYETATLNVDAANPTGALGLYEGLGFEVSKRYVAYSKPAE